MLNVGRAIRWDSALGVGRHKVSDYVTRSWQSNQKFLFYSVEVWEKPNQAIGGGAMLP